MAKTTGLREKILKALETKDEMLGREVAEIVGVETRVAVNAMFRMREVYRTIDKTKRHAKCSYSLKPSSMPVKAENKLKRYVPKFTPLNEAYDIYEGRNLAMLTR